MNSMQYGECDKCYDTLVDVAHLQYVYTSDHAEVHIILPDTLYRRARYHTVQCTGIQNKTEPRSVLVSAASLID